MSKFILPLVVYVLVLAITTLLPTSEGYDVLTWKLVIGQIYAIPALLITYLIIHFVKRKKTAL